MTISPAYIASKSWGSENADDPREIVGVKMVQYEPGHEAMLCFEVRNWNGDTEGVRYIPVETIELYRFMSVASK
jgi:hypothetical protein